MLKHLLDTLLRLGTTLQVLVRTDLLCHSQTLFVGDRRLASLFQLFNGSAVSSQILLTSNQQDRQTITKVQHLTDPLLLHIVQTVRTVYSKADEDDVRIRI